MENFKLQRAILSLSLLTFGLWSALKVTASDAVVTVDMTTYVESTTGDDDPKKNNKSEKTGKLKRLMNQEYTYDDEDGAKKTTSETPAKVESKPVTERPVEKEKVKKEKPEKTGKLKGLMNQEYTYDDEVSDKKTTSETPAKVESKPVTERPVEKEKTKKEKTEKTKKEKPEKTKKSKPEKNRRNETENIYIETNKEVKRPIEVELTPASEFKVGRPAHAGFPASSMGITWTSNIDGNTAKFTAAPNKLVILPDQATFNTIKTKEKLNQAFETGIKTGDLTVKGGSSFKPQYLIVQDGETLRLIEMTGIQFKAGENKAHFTERH